MNCVVGVWVPSFESVIWKVRCLVFRRNPQFKKDPLVWKLCMHTLLEESLGSIIAQSRRAREMGE